MSEQSNQYLIYGVKLNYEEWASDEFSDITEKFCDSAFDNEMNPNGLHCLYDGMCGDYIIIGRCLAKSECYRSLPYIDLACVDSNIRDLTARLLKDELNIDEPMSLHLITHYR